MITSTIPYKYFIFPVGEPHIKLTHHMASKVDITWEFQSQTEIVELLLLKDALVRHGHTLDKLYIPYVPFARQDRINNLGEPLSIAVMAQIINMLGAKTVIITDPHSDVTPALINSCHVIEQHEVFYPMLCMWQRGYTLVSPDAGALKKIYKLATKLYPVGVLECSKRRDVKNGEIIGVTIPEGVIDKKYVIIDDICDGGRTFIELARGLRAHGARSIVLCVTHGFFTKGLQVFDGLIDEIYTKKGRIK